MKCLAAVLGSVTACLGTVPELPSQTPPTRTLEQRKGEFFYARYLVPERGTFGSNNAETAPLLLKWFADGITVTAPTSFEVAGGIDWLATRGDRQFLVSGSSGLDTSAPASTLQVLTLETTPRREIAVRQTKTYPGTDYLAVCWNEQQGLLYVVDGLDDTLKSAPWTGPDNPLPDAALFQTELGAADVPELSDATFLHLASIPQGVRIVNKTLNVGREATRSGSSWSFRVWDPASYSPARWYVEHHREAPTSGTLDVRVEGGASGPFQLMPVLDDLPSPLASGDHPGTGVVSVPVPPVFFSLPGRPYRIEGGSYRSESVFPVLHYGSPQSTPSVTVGTDLHFEPMAFHVGVTRAFGVSATFDLAAPKQTAVTLVAHLLVGIRSGSQDPPQDPVVPVGSSGGYTIDSPAMTTFNVVFDAGQTHEVIRRRVDVPDDDTLENVVTLFQLVLEDGIGGVAFTSVKGSSVLPAWPFLPGQSQIKTMASAALSSAVNYQSYLQAAALAARTTPNVQRAWRWVGLTDQGEVPGPQRQAVRQLRRLMSR